MRVEALERVFEAGSSRPALARCEDGSRWVVKLSGAGPGARGLLFELAASRAAAALGAPVPEVRPLWLPELPWQVGTDEFDAALSRSWGWCLGVAFAPGAEPMTAAEALSRPERAAIARADALVHNVDRTAANPNLLRLPGGGVLAIDHGAALMVPRALAGRAGDWALPRGHLFEGTEIGRPPALDWPPLLGDAPDDWLAEAGTDRAALALRLAAYAAGPDSPTIS